MLSYYSEELAANASRGVVNRISDIKLEQGDLAEAWREGNTDYATVAMRYSLNDTVVDQNGRVLEGGPDEATEVWTFRRDAAASGWCRRCSRPAAHATATIQREWPGFARPLFLPIDRREFGELRRNGPAVCGVSAPWPSKLFPSKRIARPLIEQCRRDIAAAWAQIEAAREVLGSGLWLSMVGRPADWLRWRVRSRFVWPRHGRLE